jgi:choline dehydrogenase-like flavoprotein
VSTVEQTDVCIIGTGAAGGILAFRLAMAGRDVLSLEQGAEIRDEYFTNGISLEQDEYLGIMPDKPWPLPVDALFYANSQAGRLYARSDTSSTTPESATVFQNFQVFRLNGKQNLWAGAALRQSPRDFHGGGAPYRSLRHARRTRRISRWRIPAANGATTH